MAEQLDIYNRLDLGDALTSVQGSNVQVQQDHYLAIQMKKCGNDEAKFESILRSHNIDLFNVLNKNLVDLPAIKMIHNISPEMHQHISPAPDVRQIYTEYIEDFS